MADGDRRFTRKELSERDIARKNWGRYSYALTRGHADYCEQAVKLDRFYVGAAAGLHEGQWDDEDRAQVEADGRPAIEMNEIFDAINTALGNQIQNRVDIAFRPRGQGADATTASTLSKVAMQIADNNQLRHKETEVTGDGYIQQRGYFEIRVDYDDNLNGEIKIDVLDPMDVIPDPDAKSYDPDTWNDVIVTRWLSLADIETYYGRKARRKIEKEIEGEGDEDFGEGEIDGVRRSHFGGENELAPDYTFEEGWRDNVMVRIVDRQHWVVSPTLVALYPTGDIRVIEDLTPEKQQAAVNQGAMIFRRPMKRVRWTVSSYGEVLLMDGWSPYKHFTVVPYFPFFRRGKTRGLVDNAVGPQEMLNKALSQYLHIVNTTANSGWIVEQNSLTNMSTDDLEEEGSATGLVIEYKQGATAPEKITANSVPTGIDRLVQIGSSKIRLITGISDALRGQAGPNQSGKAIQSLQFGSQLSLAVPLDNLARTRHMLAERILSCIQLFMDVQQLLRIVDRDAEGNEIVDDLQVNWEQADGVVLNDLTVGEYDAIVTEQPSQVTFENSQFEQAMAMKKEGAPIPWSYILEHSPLADKNKLAEYARSQEGQTDPAAQAKAALDLASATAKNVDAIIKAIEGGLLLRSDPAIAPAADIIYKSAGGQDADGGETVPQVEPIAPTSSVALAGAVPQPGIPAPA